MSLPLPHTFPPQYEQLLRTASMPDAAPVSITFATPAKAAAFRARLYSYFRSLRSSTARPDLIPLVELLALAVPADDPKRLVLQKKATMWDAAAITSALEQLPQGAAASVSTAAHTPTPPQTPRERLAQLRHKG